MEIVKSIIICIFALIALFIIGNYPIAAIVVVALGTIFLFLFLGKDQH
jgi:uncharacterized membrane-anchored protein